MAHLDLPACCRLTEPVAGYPVLEIEHPSATARLALHGAHLMEWKPAGRRPVLYLSPQAVLKPGKAIRGGIPVCWPWFGAHPTECGLPAHGLARTRFWRLDEVREEESGVTVRLGLRDDESTRPIWPPAFATALTVSVGTDLAVALEGSNLANAPFLVGGALHTYLAVGAIEQVRVEGLEGARYEDALTGSEAVQAGPVVIDREVDRIYDHGGGCRMIDEAWGRAVTVQQSGSADLVVWNPWEEKTRSLGDLPPDGFRGFLCLEAAIASRHRVEVNPGATHRFSTRLSVEAL